MVTDTEATYNAYGVRLLKSDLTGPHLPQEGRAPCLPAACLSDGIHEASLSIKRKDPVNMAISRNCIFLAA